MDSRGREETTRNWLFNGKCIESTENVPIDQISGDIGRATGCAVLYSTWKAGIFCYLRPSAPPSNPIIFRRCSISKHLWPVILTTIPFNSVYIQSSSWRLLLHTSSIQLSIPNFCNFQRIKINENIHEIYAWYGWKAYITFMNIGVNAVDGRTYGHSIW